MAKHLDLGKAGELIARRYLERLGYKIHAANVRLKKDEIDLIAYDPKEKMIVFVEVKTRRTSSEAYPIHSAVNAHKRRCLKRAISRWVIREQYEGPGRIDVLCVENDRVTEHLINIGSPMLD